MQLRHYKIKMKSQSKQSDMQIAKLPKSNHNHKYFQNVLKRILLQNQRERFLWIFILKGCKCSWIYQFTQHLLHFITKNLIPLKLTPKKWGNISVWYWSYHKIVPIVLYLSSSSIPLLFFMAMNYMIFISSK